jgi:hypothetical protein
MFAAEDFGDTEVRDFEMTVLVQKQVFEFDVAMCNAMGVKIVDTSEQLLEQTETVLNGIVSFWPCRKQFAFDEGKQFAVATKFHNMVPPTTVVAQADGLNDVGVVQTLGYAVLRFYLFDVFFFILVLFTSTELLHGDQFFAVGGSTAGHDPYLGGGAPTQALPALARHETRRLELLVQLARVDDKFIW